MQDHKTSIIECREYIKKEINSNTFQLFDYREFKNKTYIREGAAGEIYKVERITNDKKKQKPRIFALKGFKGDPDEVCLNSQSFFRELKHFGNLSHKNHPNIIKFYGVSEDLHHGNILVRKGRMLIADFGLSRNKSSDQSPLARGKDWFVDPQVFCTDKFKPTVKSDIYSLGRLFRYIANGTLSNISLNTYIWKINDPDFQETSDATVYVPPEFSSIYNACLQIDPEKRPIVKHIYEALKKLQFDDFLHIEPFQHRLEDSMLLFVEQKHNHHSKPYLGSEILKYEVSDKMSDYDYSDEEDCDGFVNILPKINSSSISSVPSVSLASSQSSTLIQDSQQLISDKGYKLYIEGLKAKAKEDFPRTAYEYFKAAAETGHPLARKQLARCYCDGYGVKKNTNEALRLFKLSTQGDDEYHLGICYEHGNGFKKDINIARRYYKEAELLGNQKAAKRLRHLDSEQS
ncbi:kinase-like protein [Gigaspora margarita]|uniref:Kinase-like protein n=1 Tax=Gigaspora margarita TaxID=4874 RepID=A0A8H3XK92_GIGMA|nr:kinase-like protein [Gigaspora margarita]